MQKILLILLMTSLLIGCQNKPYAFQPLNPLCTKLEYWVFKREVSIYLLHNEDRESLKSMERTRTAIAQECGK